MSYNSTRSSIRAETRSKKLYDVPTNNKIISTAIDQNVV